MNSKFDIAVSSASKSEIVKLKEMPKSSNKDTDKIKNKFLFLFL